MRYLFIFLWLFQLSLNSFAQKVKEEEIFTAVEKQAEFPGGMGAFGRYLQRSKALSSLVKEYCNRGIPFSVRIECVIDKSGDVSNIKFVKSAGFEDAEKIFIAEFGKELTEKWIPASNKNIPVRSKFTIPIHTSCSE
ncbi:MAG: hypothetical protein U5N85_01990 [Arcicella sp.]|nr:hypothetical protein [Arcicella sp.]